MPRFQVTHRTQYRYSQPVRPGRHRMMLRPRDSHDLRLVESGLAIAPEPAVLRWLYDVYGNSVTIADFETETDLLSFESTLLIDHTGLDAPQLPIEPFAQSWPFNYEPHEWPDLRLFVERHYADPEARLDRWARKIIGDAIGRSSTGELETQAMLAALMSAIADGLIYAERHDEGVQPPLVTLAQGGTCRDFAVLMMEAVRSLGLAARFASGYLYVPDLDTGEPQSLRGGGATHAWVQIYLPGAGWIDYDPTNALYGGVDLIRVAVCRDPAAAAPIAGSFVGPSGVQSTMEVTVQVARVD